MKDEATAKGTGRKKRETEEAGKGSKPRTLSVMCMLGELITPRPTPGPLTTIYVVQHLKMFTVVMGSLTPELA